MMKVTLTTMSYNNKKNNNYYNIRCVHKELKNRKNSVTNKQKNYFFLKFNSGFLKANKTAWRNLRVLVKSPPGF